MALAPLGHIASGAICPAKYFGFNIPVNVLIIAVFK